MTTSRDIGPIQKYSIESGHRGLDIRTTTQLLRRYAYIERSLIKILAGWFLAAPAYETKHHFGYHLWDHAEHVDWLRKRLSEMRGGQPNASVEPALCRCLEEALHAPNIESLIGGVYLELKQSLLNCYQDHLAAADPSANAVEIRFLQRMILDIKQHLIWANSQKIHSNGSVDHKYQDWIRTLLSAAGGISGLESSPSLTLKSPCEFVKFQRPQKIIFDARIRNEELMSYETRMNRDQKTATIEDFKVFFNEFYAAALLASVIYDAGALEEVPWEFFHDFARQFWDEVRHSEFGAVRLKELGIPPEVCHPILFEQSQGLPFLHRICYLTLGLETYFMPRKEPRVRKFSEHGDHRSQLFADQDWSDEITHVRYGKRWVDYLLKDDFRTAEDILTEIREYLEKISGEKQGKITAPF